jgi:hypothetical protein
MAPGPPQVIGKGLFTDGFTAMLLVERLERPWTGNGTGSPPAVAIPW